jgi:hypothetical protein
MNEYAAETSAPTARTGFAILSMISSPADVDDFHRARDARSAKLGRNECAAVGLSVDRESRDLIDLLD